MMRLSLYASVGVASGEGLHFGFAYKVEVAVYGVFQCRCGYGEFQRLALGGFCEQAVDKAA